jgi:hypothetical protein
VTSSSFLSRPDPQNSRPTRSAAAPARESFDQRSAASAIRRDFLEAADEAGLPNDEKFRRRFREYIEWGSGMAMAVSQPGAAITTGEAVPRWDWE